MIGIETTRAIYEYFKSNKMDPIKTILEIDEPSPSCGGRQLKVRCINGLTYMIWESNGDIEKIERIEK